MSNFETRARDLTARDEFAGVVRVDRAGETIAALALGPASRAWKAPVTLDTRFDSASITKLFTAVAVLQCVERGDLALTTRVTEYLGLTDTAISPAVTVHQLLTHTSGITDVCDEDADESYAELFTDRPNASIKTTADWLPLFADRPAEFPPGTSTHYCNAGYLLLGLVVERATGRTYRDAVRQDVFARAEMTDADFFSMDRVEPRVAEAVDPVRAADGTIIGWERNIYAYPPTGAADGGAHVSADDLIAFHRALVGERLLGPELTAAMLRPHEEYNATRPRFLHGEARAGAHLTGYGFEFERDEDGVIQSYWKEGMSEGASGVLRHYPATDTTVVVLAVGADAAWPVISAIDADLEAGAIWQDCGMTFGWRKAAAVTTAIAGPAAFATAAKLGARRTNGYRPRDEPISALAARKCEGAPAMIPGFVALGTASFALGRLLRGSRLPSAVPVMMTAAGVTTTIAGLARHSDRTCPSRSFGNDNATISDELHIASSMATFAMWVAMPLVTAAGGRNCSPLGRKVSLACGATALTGMLAASYLVPRGKTRYSGAIQRATLAGAFGFYPVAAALG